MVMKLYAQYLKIQEKLEKEFKKYKGQTLYLVSNSYHNVIKVRNMNIDGVIVTMFQIYKTPSGQFKYQRQTFNYSLETFFGFKFISEDEFKKDLPEDYNLNQFN